MKSRVKKRKVHYSDARNMRSVSYKYIPVDDVHTCAIAGGRCHKCRKITVDSCALCERFVCQKHSKISENIIFCENCYGNRTRPDYVG